MLLEYPRTWQYPNSHHLLNIYYIYCIHIFSKSFVYLVFITSFFSLPPPNPQQDSLVNMVRQPLLLSTSNISKLKEVVQITRERFLLHMIQSDKIKKPKLF